MLGAVSGALQRDLLLLLPGSLGCPVCTVLSRAWPTATCIYVVADPVWQACRELHASISAF
jgi:hypothetical protein